MGKSSNFIVPLACTASLSLGLVLSGCSDRPNEKAPASGTSASVFKDSPPPRAASPGSTESPTAQASPPPANPTRTPEQLFFNLGCRACHGPGSAYAASIVNARSIVQARARTAEEIARYILHPEKVRPKTMMPSYAHRMTEEEALSLGRWIKAGNPPPPAD
jgi:mono/diheme cytochrome c family protein